MRVTARWADSTLTLDLRPEEGDGLVRGRARLVGTTVRFRVPVPLGADDVHPDAEALLALLVVQPFVGPSVTLSRGVSAELAAAVEDSFGKHVAPVDPSLGPRRPPAGSVVGLAYSAGADSTAALAVQRNFSKLASCWIRILANKRIRRPAAIQCKMSTV